MKLSLIIISLSYLFPAIVFAQDQYGAFGPVPPCNCTESQTAQPPKLQKPRVERHSGAQQIEATAVASSRSEVLTQNVIKLAQKKMAERIVEFAGREADASALDQREALGFAVVVLEVSLDSEGHVYKVEVIRWPSNDAARFTADLAVSAVRSAAPYHGVLRRAGGMKIMQTFIFKNDRKFYLRALAE